MLISTVYLLPFWHGVYYYSDVIIFIYFCLGMQFVGSHSVSPSSTLMSVLRCGSFPSRCAC